MGTHTHTKSREKRRLGKQRKEKPKPEKHRKKREGGKPGRGPAFSACSGPPPPPRAHNVGTKPGLPGLWPEGAQPRRVAGDNSQVPEIPSPPGSIPSPAVLRPATYFWSIPAGQAPAGRAGRRPRTRAWWQRPLTRSTLTSTRPCQPPARRRRVWNPLLSLRFPAQLLAIGRELRPQLCRAPPPSGGGDTPAWRGREGLPGEEPAGPLGTQAGSGDPEQPRDEDSFKVGAAWARVAGGGDGVLDSGFQELIGTPLCTAARFLCPSLC